MRGQSTGVDRTFNITAGDFFMRGYTAEATNQLVETIQAGVRALAGTDFDSFTCTLSDSGYVSMSNPSEDFRIASGTDTALLTLLGYDDGTTLLSLPTAYAATHTGSHQARYCWFPPCGVAETRSHQSVLGATSSDAVVRRAPSGRVITTTYDTYREQMLEWRWLEDEYVWPVGVGGTTVKNRDFLQFWTDVLKSGQRFRYFPDRTSNTSTAYYEYVGGEKITKDGMEKCRREVASFSKYWKFDMDCLEYVSS